MARRIIVVALPHLAAEARAGVSGMGRLAEFLGRELAVLQRRHAA